MSSRHTFIATALIALVASACGTSSSSTSARATSTTQQSSTGYGHPGVPGQADRTIDIRALNTMRFDPSSVSVKQGETVTFRIQNVSSIEHEFVLGTQAVQQEHEREMQSMGTTSTSANGATAAGTASAMASGMADKADAVSVPAGQTKELTWTFSDPGTVIYGCHEPGHYAAGMKGTITVT